MQAAAEPHVFTRLLQEIQKSEHYAVVLEVASSPFLPGGGTERDRIASMLAFNTPIGEQEHWAISPEKFLMHVEDELDDGLHVGHNWKQAWNDLRAAYWQERI
ncbi:hypothetical protein N7G274_005099 [Stereocaulon virgatum]|uniref:Uncharacterized protein n=1 Tax=Stereocaulon virgatum TaxID=373712 RepID=A0ABR4ABP1_9LECA